MKKLNFGTAGIPISTTGDTLQGIKDVKTLNLDAFELEFVRSININEEKAKEVKNVAKNNNIILTCHAPYFINLNSEEKPKLFASIKRIVDSAKIASLCNAYSVTFHSGFYQKQSPEIVYQKISSALKEIIRQIKEFDDKIYIRPEISGKISQFGNLNELIQLSQEIPQVLPCIDFSHFFARTLGEYNTKEKFNFILTEIEKRLGKEALANSHFHVSGIEFTDKGERHHLTLENSKFNYKDLLKVLKEFNTKGVLISESPNIETDALLMKKYYFKI